MALIKILFKVILSSPSDLLPERAIVKQIIDEINETYKNSKFGLALKLWEDDVSPILNLVEGQHVIDDELGFDDSDLVIGMFYKKLGTPVFSSESGTVHEINQAIESYRNKKCPDIMLYFKKVTLKLSDTSETTRNDYDRLEKKKNEYMKLGIVQMFDSAKDFELKCRKHILKYLNKKISEHSRYPLLSPNEDLMFVKSRKSFERMEEIIATAKEDIHILGINLEAVVNMQDLIYEKANSGISIRLLALNPDGTALEHFNINNINKEYRKSKIVSNLQILSDKLRALSNCEIKVIDRIFVSGCTSIDMHSKNGRIVAQLYLNNVGTAKAPIMDIYNSQTPSWFNIYKEYLLSLWNEAAIY